MTVDVPEHLRGLPESLRAAVLVKAAAEAAKAPPPTRTTVEALRVLLRPTARTERAA